jgi:hypothetical protein
MPPRIEDYALIGDAHAAALVSGEGSIDWLCLPRLDSAASFAALLGNEANGRWQVAPSGSVRTTRRRYRADTLVLETDFETAEGSIRLVDFMPPPGVAPDVVRLVVGVRGRVRVHMDLRPRFEGGRIRPSLRHIDGADVASVGGDSLWLRTPVETRGQEGAVQVEFLVSAGELLPFALTWKPSHEPAPVPVDPLRALAEAESLTGQPSRIHSAEARRRILPSLEAASTTSPAQRCVRLINLGAEKRAARTRLP